QIAVSNCPSYNLLMASQICSDEQYVQPYLDWKHRPKKVVESIDAKHKEILTREPSKAWHFTGTKNYHLARIDEYTIIKTLTTNSQNQKTFNIMDVGAGNFTLGNHLEKMLNNDTSIPSDVTFNIFGLSGDNHKSKIESIGKCTTYQFGGFKIEEVTNELNKKGIYLENSFDFIISRMTFLHLIDPLGTFQQIYDLLKPKTGFLITDGFSFINKDSKGNLIYDHTLSSTYDLSSYFNAKNVDGNMLLLLDDLDANFLFSFTHVWDGYSHFVIKKLSDLKASLSYI